MEGVSETSENEHETMQEKRARFEKLAMPAVNALYRQAMKFTNNPEDAPRIWCKTRSSAASRPSTPSSRVPISKPLMTTIERNAFFNQYAKAKRRPQRANDSTGEYDDWDIFAASEHTSQGLQSAEQQYLEAFAPEEIMAALDRLPRSAARRSSMPPSMASRTSRWPMNRASRLAR